LTVVRQKASEVQEREATEVGAVLEMEVNRKGEIEILKVNRASFPLMMG